MMHRLRLLQATLALGFLSVAGATATEMVSLKPGFGKYKPKAAIRDEPTGHVRESTVWYCKVKRSTTKLRVEREGPVDDFEVERLARSTREIKKELQEDALQFSAFLPGVYRVNIKAGHKDYRLKFPKGMETVVEASKENPLFSSYYGHLFFFVPKGTETVRAKAKIRLSVLPPGEDKRTDFANDAKRSLSGHVYDEGERDEHGYFSVEIPVEGRDGKVWCVIDQTRGEFYLENVPPYLATRPELLLVPKGTEGGALR